MGKGGKDYSLTATGVFLLKREAQVDDIQEVATNRYFYSYIRGVRREYYDKVSELLNTRDPQRIEVVLQAFPYLLAKLKWKKLKS